MTTLPATITVGRQRRTIHAPAMLWYRPRPAIGTGLGLNGIALILTSPAGWPTIEPLTAGALWANGIFVNVTPGTTPNPSAPPIYFGIITAAALLALGAGNLPLVDPLVLNQLWLNGVQVCASSG
jgi:hypothetical protein